MSQIAPRRPLGLRFLAFLAALTAALPSSTTAQEKGESVTCAATHGVLLAETKTGWKALKAGDVAPPEATLVSLFDATLRSANGGVEARLVSDLAQRGPFPTLESAVAVHEDAKHDLALTPLRGLIVLTNKKKEGSATIQLRLRDEMVELTLKEPGAKLALEIYGRHAPGAPNLDDPKLDDPVMHLFFISLSGDAFLRHGEKGVALHEPPGPAILVWDSLTREPQVQRLEAIPPEVTAMKEKDVKLLDQVNKWAAKLSGDSPAQKLLALKEGAASKNLLLRKAAVTAMGALDHLPALAVVLASSSDSETRDHAVLTMRHWLGRAPGQTAKLNAGLAKAGYTPVQANTLVHFLYGFTAEEKREPGTYEVLVNSLKHSRPAVRQLAHWHLVRLAPDGKSIPFDALASEAERERSYEQWLALIPTGKLPPPSKTVSKAP